VTGARAQTAAEAEQADRLFAEATTLAEHGDFATACPKLEQSQRLDPALGTQYNLALCYRHVGRLGSAWRNFRAVERLAHTAGKTGREQAAHKELDALRARVPHLVFIVNEPAASVEVDGERVDREDLAFFAVDPGEHTILVTASAKNPWRTVRRVEGAADGSGSAESVTVPALTVAAGQSRIVTITRDAPSTKRTVGFVLLAVGTVGVIASAVTGVLILNAKATADDQCTPVCAGASGVSAVNRGRTLVPINYVSWGAAAVGLGVGAYLVLTSRSSSPSSPLPTRAVVAPLLGGGTTGLAVSSVF
jgi:hypothetical protein